MLNTQTAPTRFVIGAFDAFPANVAILNAEGQIVAVNQAWIDFAQDNGGEVCLDENYLEVCRATDGEDRITAQAIATGIEAVLNGALSSFELEYPCHTHTQQRFFLARVSGFSQDNEQFVVVLHHDITRRKQMELEVQALNRTLEERVAQRTHQWEEVQHLLQHRNQELQARNRELAQFAYMASHDLQEPLRLLGLYADVLRHRWQDQLDDRAREVLNVMLEQVVRARQMVADILTLADVRAMPVLERVNVNKLWDSVVLTLPWPAQAQFERDELPVIPGNPSQLRQLLMNLLGNAIKFRAEQPLRVSLSVTVSEAGAHFVLRDNGIGIPADKREQVFDMFSRLNARSRFAGNGIGLAVCQRIVEHHGGQIWMMGEPPGVEVHFQLPLARPAEEESSAPEPAPAS